MSDERKGTPIIALPARGKGNGRRLKPTPYHVGRQSKLTPEVHKKVVDAVRAGAFLSVAAQYAGISQGTLQGWMRRGRECTSRSGKDAVYLTFLEDVAEAEAASEVAANVQWRAAWAKDWHSAQKWLESRYPERYGANKDANSPTGAFAGVNVTITGQGNAGGTNIGQVVPNDANVALESLIERNPKLLGATMQLFDQINAIYGEDEEDTSTDGETERYTPPSKSTQVDDFGVIEGDYTPIDRSDDE